MVVILRWLKSGDDDGLDFRILGHWWHRQNNRLVLFAWRWRREVGDERRRRRLLHRDAFRKRWRRLVFLVLERRRRRRVRLGAEAVGRGRRDVLFVDADAGVRLVRGRRERVIVLVVRRARALLAAAVLLVAELAVLGAGGGGGGVLAVAHQIAELRDDLREAEPGVRVLLPRVLDDALERAVGGHRRAAAGEDVREDAVLVRHVRVRVLLVPDGQQQHGERVDVARRGVLLVLEHLRRDEYRRADVLRHLLLHLVGDDAARPKVRDLRAHLRVRGERHQQDVVALQVAVEDAVRVQVAHPHGDVERDGELQRHGELARLEVRRERPELAQLHHDVRRLSLGRRPHERDDVCRAETAHEVELLLDVLVLLRVLKRHLNLLDGDVLAPVFAAKHTSVRALSDQLTDVQVTDGKKARKLTFGKKWNRCNTFSFVDLDDALEHCRAD